MACLKVLTIGSELDSAKHLGLPTYTSPYSISCTNHKTICIRWGNSEHWHDGEFPKVINPQKAIRLNCLKEQALAEMSKVVTTPKLYASGDRVPKGKTAVLRPCQHSGGEGFSIVNGPFDIPEDYYCTSFIASNFEFRVWFAGQATMFARRMPMQGQGGEKYPCRSNWGYRFAGYLETPSSLHNDVLKAAKAIGLEVGAADIILSGSRFYFLELNSAPSIDHSRLEAFFKENLPVVVKSKYP